MSAIQKIRKKSDRRIADDDHLKRKDITKGEFIKAADEVYEENKDKPAVNKKSSKFAHATIESLRSL
jgi:hypothetical protein